jgi:hypothetical protein
MAYIALSKCKSTHSGVVYVKLGDILVNVVVQRTDTPTVWPSKVPYLVARRTARCYATHVDDGCRGEKGICCP